MAKFILLAARRSGQTGEIFYGTDGYLVELTETHFVAYDKDLQVIKEFTGEGNHFENFIDSCVSGNAKDLNADVREGHLSATISHLGNIAYEVGEENSVSVNELRKALADVKSLDDNVATLDRTVQHLMDNGVDLDKYPLKMSPVLEFDPEQEVFPDSPEANALVTRDYRNGFACPKAENV